MSWLCPLHSLAAPKSAAQSRRFAAVAALSAASGARHQPGQPLVAGLQIARQGRAAEEGKDLGRDSDREEIVPVHGKEGGTYYGDEGDVTALRVDLDQIPLARDLRAGRASPDRPRKTFWTSCARSKSVALS